MNERIEEELALLRGWFSHVEYLPDGRWVRLREYRLPSGWDRTTTDVVFQIHAGHPGSPPYGICVPAGLRFEGKVPGSYREPAQSAPPFGGSWGFFSWAIDGPWQPKSPARSGSNLLNWAVGLAHRFREGA